MKYILNYEVAKRLLEEWDFPLNRKPGYAFSWLLDFDDAKLEEGERLNVMLTALMWEVENDDLGEEECDELYLYYKQLVKGELDDVIDGEEREDVVRDLTYCFNKAFPNGLED